MPLKDPSPGKLHMVVAFKGAKSNPSRVELTGELSADQAQMVLRLAQMKAPHFLKIKEAIDAILFKA